jgi:hypothetical protein
MVLWISLVSCIALVVAVIALIVAMSRADRRARRSLFRGLGLNEETVELLMDRNGDVLSELALVRIVPPDEQDRVEAPVPAENAPRRPQPAIRLVHPAPDEPDTSDLQSPQPYPNRGRGV